MEIKKVELLQPDELQTEMGAVPAFRVTTPEGVVTVTADPANRHYHEIAEWYGRHKNPGFEYDFYPKQKNKRKTK